MAGFPTPAASGRLNGVTHPIYFWIVVCRFLCPLALADTRPDTQPAIHQEILQTYNFQPRQLDDQGLKQKSDVLDKFWAKAKSHATEYVPVLRKELADFSNPPFFLFDGSMLLLSLSKESSDRRVALAAIAHCDLRDVQPREYFHQVHRMAALGENTTEAAFRLLEDPGYRVIVPQHALTLAQDYALVYLLIPTEQSFWEQPAIDRLKTEPDETAQKSLLLLLFYAQTSACDQAIKQFAKDAKKPSASRSYATEMLNRWSGWGIVLGKVSALFSTEAALRQKRRERMKSVSDEALYDLDDYTRSIMAKR